MAKASIPLMKDEYKRRAYVKPDVDPIADAVVISRKVQKNSCFSATAAGIVLLAVAVWGVIGLVLS